MPLYIHSIETFGAHEGPGLRLVVFLQGCNFACLYCHNPDTKSLPCQDSKTISNEEILDILDKNKEYYKNGGITVSGGEPTLQAKALSKLFLELKNNGYHTALDTNGSVFNDDVRELLDYTDLVLLDVKHINPEKHKQLTGRSNQKTLEFADYLEKTKKPFWLRYVLVPGLTDGEEDLRVWAKHFGSFESLQRVEILPYHTLGVYKYEQLGQKYCLKGVEPPKKEQVQKAKNIFEEYLGSKVFVR